MATQNSKPNVCNEHGQHVSVCMCCSVCVYELGVGRGSDKDAFYAQRPLPN